MSTLSAIAGQECRMTSSPMRKGVAGKHQPLSLHSSKTEHINYTQTLFEWRNDISSSLSTKIRRRALQPCGELYSFSGIVQHTRWLGSLRITFFQVDSDPYACPRDRPRHRTHAVVSSLHPSSVYVFGRSDACWFSSMLVVRQWMSTSMLNSLTQCMSML